MSQSCRPPQVGLPRPLGQAHGGDVWGAARALGRPMSEILDLSASLNPLGPPPGLGEVISRALELICHYPDRNTTELRQALARHLDLPPEAILPGNGSTALIRLLARALTMPDIVVFAPTFMEFPRALAQFGAHFHFHLLSEANHFAPTAHDLDQLWERQPGAVILGNPLTPSGGLVDIAMLEHLLSQARSRCAWLVVDEAFIDFAPAAARAWAPKAVMNYDRLVVLRSLTKFYCLAGLRLGYLICHPDTAVQLAPLGEPWSVNTLAQVAGTWCLEQTEYAAQTRRVVRHWRDIQAQALRARGLEPFPSQANYLLVRLPAEGPDASQVAARCFQEGVLVRDCANFAGCGPYHLRMAVAAPEEQKRLLAALETALGSGADKETGSKFAI